MSTKRLVKISNSFQFFVTKVSGKSSLKLIAAALSITALTYPDSGYADCVCSGAVKSLKDSYAESDGVFVASVERFQKSALRPGMFEAQMRIMSRYKGFEEVRGNTIYLYTPEQVSDCGLKLLVGQDYIVYAKGTPARFVSTSCTRTGILDNALDDMEALSRMAGKR